MVLDGDIQSFVDSFPLLRQTTHIIVDEAHERDINIDFLLVVLRTLIKRYRV